MGKCLSLSKVASCDLVVDDPTKDMLDEIRGEVKFADGSVYSGQWLNDKKHGYGVFVASDNSIYKGLYYGNKMHGQGNLEYSSDPLYVSYIGEFNENVRCGEGVAVMHNGDVYKGKFADDCFNGRGQMKYKNGDEYYGEWKSMKRNDLGKLTRSNGDEYTGEWLDDALECCTIHFASGDVYLGYVKDFKMHGRGKLTTKINRKVFNGFWKNGVWEGEGRENKACEQ